MWAEHVRAVFPITGNRPSVLSQERELKRKPQPRSLKLIPLKRVPLPCDLDMMDSMSTIEKGALQSVLTAKLAAVHRANLVTERVS
jgi:hypothetical protein